MYNKIYIIAILLLFYTTNIFADKYLINSAIFYKDSVWQKTIFNYNSNKKIINETVFVSKDKIEWENYTYSTRQYKGDAVSEICDYIWNNNSWKICKKQDFKYDNNKLITHTTTYDNTQDVLTYKYIDNTIIQEQQFFQNNTLKNSITTIQKTQNNKINYIKTFSLSSNKDTIFSQITTFNYDSNQTISITYEKLNKIYSPTKKTITISDNNIAFEIQYEYKNNNWIPYAKQTSYYNSKKQITDIIYQFWEIKFWLSYHRCSYSYNEDGSLASKSFLILQNKVWETSYQIYYNYNCNNQLINAFIEQSFWSEKNKEYNDYISLSGNNKPPFLFCNNIELDYTNIPTDITLNISPINIYPNPSKSGIIFINTNLIIHNIAIYNVNGILLYQNQYVGHIDLSHLDNGIYIIQITTNEGNFSFKQIINNY